MFFKVEIESFFNLVNVVNVNLCQVYVIFLSMMTQTPQNLTSRELQEYVEMEDRLLDG